MRVITIAAQKGGAGKSTIAAHLGVLADRDASPALLVDTDPQGSLAFWHGLRQAPTPVLVREAVRELPGILDAARADGVRWAIVDTPPHASADIAAAIRSADLTLIPTRPATFDLAAVAATVDMAKALGRPFVAVINAAPPRRGIGDVAVVAEARTVLERMGAPVVGVLTSRASFGHALASGEAVAEFEPTGPAAYEMAKLWRAVKAAAEAAA